MNLAQTKRDDISLNLIDYCHDYIQNCNDSNKGKKQTYNLCVDYLYGALTEPLKSKLITLLSQTK